MENTPLKPSKSPTASLKHKRDTLWLASIILNFGPLIGLVGYAMINGAIETSQKFVVGSTVTVAFILMMLNVLCKLQLRSPIFIILLGLFVAFFRWKDLILGIMTYMCIITILDEFYLTPMYKKYHRRYETNIEIDRRGL